MASKCPQIGEKDNNDTICQHDAIIEIFWRCRAPLVKFSYSSNFHVNTMTDSGVMKIFVYRGGEVILPLPYPD